MIKYFRLWRVVYSDVCIDTNGRIVLASMVLKRIVWRFFFVIKRL